MLDPDHRRLGRKTGKVRRFRPMGDTQHRIALLGDPAHFGNGSELQPPQLGLLEAQKEHLVRLAFGSDVGA